MDNKLNFAPIFASWENLLQGTWVTIQITICALILGSLIGLLVGIGRLNKKHRIAYEALTVYVMLIRGTPLIVQLFIWFYGLSMMGLMLPTFFCGVIGLGLYSGAYVSEIVRGAIQSIDRGQMEAARSTGMSYMQAMRKIILPQAIVRMIPPWGNEVIALIKNSALVSFISIHEVMKAGDTISSISYRYFEVYIVIACIYLVLTGTAVFIFKKVEARLKAGGMVQ